MTKSIDKATEAFLATFFRGHELPTDPELIARYRDGVEAAVNAFNDTRRIVYVAPNGRPDSNGATMDQPTTVEHALQLLHGSGEGGTIHRVTETIVGTLINGLDFTGEPRPGA